jgi:hypothetical protein
MIFGWWFRICHIASRIAGSSKTPYFRYKPARTLGKRLELIFYVSWSMRCWHRVIACRVGLNDIDDKPFRSR